MYSVYARWSDWLAKRWRDLLTDENRHEQVKLNNADKFSLSLSVESYLSLCLTWLSRSFEKKESIARSFHFRFSFVREGTRAWLSFAFFGRGMIEHVFHRSIPSQTHRGESKTNSCRPCRRMITRRIFIQGTQRSMENDLRLRNRRTRRERKINT